MHSCTSASKSGFRLAALCMNSRTFMPDLCPSIPKFQNGGTCAYFWACLPSVLSVLKCGRRTYGITSLPLHHAHVRQQPNACLGLYPGAMRIVCLRNPYWNDPSYHQSTSWLKVRFWYCHIGDMTNIDKPSVITELIIGYALPGRPIAMMMFKTWGYIVSNLNT